MHHQLAAAAFVHAAISDDCSHRVHNSTNAYAYRQKIMTPVLSGWASMQCHLQPMEQLEQHVATEVQAGKDEAALLWRFV